ncbi:conserved hypothetical protein [Candidatus Terasakiella magnetica]|uniref:Hemerythrin-like domain-containing protein n=1 Tax=Candidatus Terasakiella magnetica TaxID=1867952 RepID=A0A1C3RFN0_9PROT|nr:hemerythrin domain-containing protein [Candidatus Terasakiella magnetica]SCA56022.1 conserved hypothetical protein [Candidatus Terasakiella magnetica]
MRTTIKVLAREHLALNGIARILKIDANLIRDGKVVSHELLDDIVTYIREFPNKIHHPKEENFLFKAMRERSEETHEVLDHLYEEHEREYEMIEYFSKALADYKVNPRKEAKVFAQIAIEYAEFLEGHIRYENSNAFPLANAVLTEEDWEKIDVAFADNKDPISNPDEMKKFADLHHRIMDLGLPPFDIKHKDRT